MGKTFKAPARATIFFCIIFRDGSTSQVYTASTLTHARNILLGEEMKYPKEVFFCPIPADIIFMNENSKFYYMHKRSIALNYNEFKNGKNPWPLDYIPEESAAYESLSEDVDQNSGV